MKKLILFALIILATSSFAQVPNYVPTNGLVGWWPFNGNANDESGNGNNGTVTGALLTSDRNSNLNSAYSFDGNGDFINCGNSPTVNITGSVSISAWIYANNLSGDHGIISKMNTGIATYELITAGNLFRLMDVGGFLYSNSINPNQWIHVVSVFNSSSLLKSIYINGVLNTTSISLVSTIPTNSDNLYIGAHQPSIVPGWSWDGKLDEIGVWNRALTACEIKNLYNGGVPNSSQTQTALDTYTWPVNNQTYTQSGTYTDTLVNAAGCDSIITLNLTLSFTGINELNTSTLSISPNPTAGDFTIAGMELYNNISRIHILDVNGKLIKELDPTASKFTLGTVQPGVYFLTISAGNKQDVIKLIKE